jgi:hypothetical protein
VAHRAAEVECPRAGCPREAVECRRRVGCRRRAHDETAARRSTGLTRARVTRSLFSVCLVAVLAQAQDPRGKVVGRVADATGAVVPNAEVRITNQNTGVAVAARSTGSGDFVLPYLTP